MREIALFAKNKWSKSVLVLIVSVFWFGYVAISATQFYFNVKDVTEIEVQKRVQQLQFVQDNLTSLVVTENFESLKDRLEQARNLHLVDFYILQKDKDVVLWYNNFDNLEGINYDYQSFNQILQNDELAFRTIKLMEYRLTVGVFQDRTKIMWATAWIMKSFIIRDLVLVTLILTLVVYLFLKDILNLSKVLGSRDRSQIANIKSLSKEGQTLLRATQSYEDTKKYLEYENRYYSDSLTPAILHEMKSGQKAPYAFQSTMIRIDLNGYTQIFLEKKDEYVTDIMNTYFIMSRELIERYQGLIYQYVGDEIVFHIKEQENESSEAMALACLRSVFEAAQKIEDSLPDGADHYFKVKGSFVLGKIRFVPQEAGFALSGLPLIESARLLSQVDEKTSSSVTFYAEAASKVEGLCIVADTKETLLKGFSKPSTLYRVKEFTLVRDALKKDANFARYYRSDDDLMQIFGYLSEKVKEGDEEVFFKIFSVLKTFTVKRTTAEYVSAFVKLLNSVKSANQGGQANDKVLASVISLSSTLIPPAMVSDQLLDALQAFLEHKDHRVQANTIIVLGDLAKDISFLKNYMYAKNNRVSADTLLVSGKRSLDSDLVKKLHEYLDSKNPLFKASGEFVVRSLSEHYKMTDPIFFETNGDLKGLLGRLEDLDFSKNNN